METTKTPTWQWVAMSAISLLLVVASILMNETRSDIREVRTQISQMSPRIAAVEVGQSLQYSLINEREADIKAMLAQIIAEQKTNTDALTKHMMGDRR